MDTVRNLKRHFKIIQDTSMSNNMKKVQEMHSFFEDEYGLQREIRIRGRILNLTKLCSLLLMLIGIYGMHSMLRYPMLLGNKQMEIMSWIAVGSGIMVNLYTIYARRQLIKAGFFERYNSADMLLYWLLDDDEVTDIVVEKHGKIIRMIRDDFSIRLKVKEYIIIGEGEYVTEINLDEKLIVLGN